MKKKISIILSAIILIVVSAFITGCSCNQRIWDTNYTYNRCLVREGDVWVEYVVDSWNDYEDGTVTVWTTDGQMIFTHTTNIILYGVDK
jgi:hypothetical protein